MGVHNVDQGIKSVYLLKGTSGGWDGTTGCLC